MPARAELYRSSTAYSHYDIYSPARTNMELHVLLVSTNSSSKPTKEKRD